jgi:hypothetical protein
MRRKSILHVLVILVLYFVILSLCSCNKEENPVKTVEPPPPPGPDTVSRYKWTVTPFYAPAYNLYVADTNNIYVVLVSYLVLFDGTNYSPVIVEPNYDVFNVYGYDKDNIFATGYYKNNNALIPFVKKITGGNIQTYTYENEQDISFDILVTGPNQAWFSSFYESKVYYYDNGNLSVYRLSDNDSISTGRFYKDQNSNLYVFASNSRSSYFFGNLYTYKFYGNDFNLIRTDVIDIHNCDGKTHLISRCGLDAVMIPFNSMSKLYYFNGSDWIIHSSPFENDVPTKVGGVSRDSLTAYFGPSDVLYTFGGTKWRKENQVLPIAMTAGVMTNTEAKFGNIYFTICNESMGRGWIISGKPNKNVNK